MDFKEFQRLAKFAQKNGIKRLKAGDIEIEFTPEALEKSQNTEPQSKDEPVATEQYSEEDMLFWSSTAFINEDKSEH